MSNSGPSSGYSALPPLLHSLCLCTPSVCALPLFVHSLCLCTPSVCALPLFVHSICLCTPSTLALPPVPLPPVLDITLDLTLVKSTSDPYLSSSDLVPFTSLSLIFLHRPCNTSSPFLLPLRFIFLPLHCFPVPGLFSCLLLLCPLSQH